MVCESNHCHIWNLVIQSDVEPTLAFEAIHCYMCMLLACVGNQFLFHLFPFQLYAVKGVNIEILIFGTLLLFLEACSHGKHTEIIINFHLLESKACCIPNGLGNKHCKIISRRTMIPLCAGGFHIKCNKSMKLKYTCFVVIQKQEEDIPS